SSRRGGHAENPCNRGPLQVGRLGACLKLDGDSHAARKAGLRLDARVLNEAGFIFGFGGHVSFRESLVYITADNTASDKNILLSISMHTRCICGQRVVDGHQWRQFFPENWKATEIESLNHFSVA